MPPIFGEPKFTFIQDSEEDDVTRHEEEMAPASLSQMAFWYLIVLIIMLLTWLLVFFCLRLIALRQKTRSPQERRMYVGSRARPSFAQPEPTIYVSPANLPPPPKYEAMAPPSYEEVVGIHYPQFQAQPITQPITAAMAQCTADTSINVTGSVMSNASNVTSNVDEPSTVITVSANERRTSISVATSS